MKREKFDLAQVKALLRSAPDKRVLNYLYKVSLELFDLYNLELRPAKFGKRADEKIKETLANNRLLRSDRTELDSRRLKKRFLATVVNKALTERRASEESAKLKEKFRQEYYLSLLFSPRQKELFYKKMHGEKMGKTEREYFSRVVKKKLQALGDPDLHRLAQKVLQTTLRSPLAEK